jgi:hypothetical protein
MERGGRELEDRGLGREVKFQLITIKTRGTARVFKGLVATRL